MEGHAAKRQEAAAGGLSNARDLSAFLGVTAAAQLLNVSEATIRRFLTQRRLKRYKVGARTLVRRSELLALVREA